MDTDVIGGSSTGQTAAGARFWPLMSLGLAPNTTVAASQSPMGAAGTVKNLSVTYETAPGVGLTRTFTIYKNGVATAVTGTTAANGTSASDLVNSVAFVAGDTLSMGTTASGTTTTTGALHWTVGITSAANVSHISTVSDVAASNSATNYISLQSGGLDATAANVEVTFPTGGTIKNLYLVANAAPGAATSYAITLVQNGTPTSLSASVSGTGTTGNDTNGAHAVTITAGDKLYYQCVPTGTPAARSINIGVEFDPTTNGESVQCYGSGSSLSATATRFTSPSGMNTVSATESTRTGLTQACVLKKMYFNLSVAPGAAKQYLVQSSINGTPSNPNVTIAGAATTTGNDVVNTSNASLSDLISYRIVPTGTPAVAVAEVSMVTFITPPTTGTVTFITYKPPWRN